MRAKADLTRFRGSIATPSRTSPSMPKISWVPRPADGLRVFPSIAVRGRSAGRPRDGRNGCPLPLLECPRREIGAAGWGELSDEAIGPFKHREGRLVATVETGPDT